MTPLSLLVVADVSPLGKQGGAERVLQEHAHGLVSRGHRVRLLCRAPDGVPAGPADWSPQIPLTHFPAGTGAAPRVLRETVRNARRATEALLTAEPVDLLHCHQPFAALGALTAPAAREVKSLYTFHSPAPLEYRSRQGMSAHHHAGLLGKAIQGGLWLLERQAVRKATCCHVLSDFAATQLATLYRLPGSRCYKIPGGVDLQRFTPAADPLHARPRLGMPLDRPVFVTVRNLEARMGLDLLLDAMAHLKAQGCIAQLWIGGTGSQGAALQAQARARGLTDQVRFLGFIPEADLPAYYQAATAFLLPTRELEGFGLVTPEALACGTPVLGTKVGAIPEVLGPLSPTLLFPACTPDAFARTLLHFLATSAANRSWYTELRAACRRHAEARYDWAHHLGQLEDLLLWLRGITVQCTAIPTLQTGPC